MPSRPHLSPRGAVIAGCIATAVVALPGMAAPTTPTTTQTCPIAVVGQDPDPVALSGATSLWPPNHQLVGYKLTASETAGESGDGLPHGVSISYSVSVTENGTTVAATPAQASPPSGNKSGDFSVTVPFQLRAERAGKSTGRTYTINWSASFDGGVHTCSSTDGSRHPFVVTVPHDQRHH